MIDLSQEKIAQLTFECVKKETLMAAGSLSGRQDLCRKTSPAPKPAVIPQMRGVENE